MSAPARERGFQIDLNRTRRRFCSDETDNAGPPTLEEERRDMRSIFPPILRGGLTFLLFLGQTFLVCLPLYLLILLKVLLPFPACRRRIDRWLTAVAGLWIHGAVLIMRLIPQGEWDIEDAGGMAPDQWYLLVANHQSWVDILVLLRVFGRRMPFPRFFTKKELLWLPLVGFAIWGLDFPLVARYSKEEIKRNPELRGHDIEIARRACEKYRQQPVTIVNFPEGTRLTPEKKARQESPFQFLLRPHTGGLALVLTVLGDKLETMLDTTIVYPAGRPRFRDFLCGRVVRMRVRVRRVAIPEEFRKGDLLDNDALRGPFQAWVEDLWERKDRLIGRLLSENSGEAGV
jgi:1-acyl-sn-glycerol-3-phosphate acyltransferase